MPSAGVDAILATVGIRLWALLSIALLGREASSVVEGTSGLGTLFARNRDDET